MIIIDVKLPFDCTRMGYDRREQPQYHADIQSLLHNIDIELYYSYDIEAKLHMCEGTKFNYIKFTYNDCMYAIRLKLSPTAGQPIVNDEVLPIVRFSELERHLIKKVKICLAG